MKKEIKNINKELNKVMLTEMLIDLGHENVNIDEFKISGNEIIPELLTIADNFDSKNKLILA